MAAKKTVLSVLTEKVKVKRPGVYAKKRASKLKTSKNYLKRYKGQGK